MLFGREFSNKVSDLINPSPNAPIEKAKNVGEFGLSNKLKKSSEIKKVDYDDSCCDSYTDMKYQRDDTKTFLDKVNNISNSNYNQYNLRQCSNVPEYDVCINNDSRILQASSLENICADISPLDFNFRNLTEGSEYKINGNFGIDYHTFSKNHFSDDKKVYDMGSVVQNSNSTLRESNILKVSVDICEQGPRTVIESQTNSPPKNYEFSLKSLNDKSQQSSHFNSIYTEITSNKMHFEFLNNKMPLKKVCISKTSIDNLFVNENDQGRSPSSSRSGSLMGSVLRSPNSSKKSQEAHKGGGIEHDDDRINSYTAKSAEGMDSIQQNCQQELVDVPTTSFAATYFCSYTRAESASFSIGGYRVLAFQHQQSAGPCHISQSSAWARNNLHNSSGGTRKHDDECQNNSDCGLLPKEGLDKYGVNFRNFKVYSAYSLKDSFGAGNFEPKVQTKSSKPFSEMEDGNNGDSATSKDKSGCEMKNVDHEEFTSSSGVEYRQVPAAKLQVQQVVFRLYH
ncbi:hypothetical protein AYI70_g2992 [Smittium culicis]|uniref:Uncharacterized protein n=1 Tax=Smittium culicis TaxID=133412 RepID=A0A1R1Y6E7_9FUNG|nr:hypothetical protein AYI70_g2992 [Smittium culicis]